MFIDALAQEMPKVVQNVDQPGRKHSRMFDILPTETFASDILAMVLSEEGSFSATDSSEGDALEVLLKGL